MVQDSWTGEDKVKHFIGCLGIVVCTYSLCLFLLWLLPTIIQDRLNLGRDEEALGLRISKSSNTMLILFSGLVSISIGALKELGDMYNWWPMCPCSPSWRDFAADAIGVCAGITLLKLGCYCILNPTTCGITNMIELCNHKVIRDKDTEFASSVSVVSEPSVVVRIDANNMV